jgi:uncharacterized OB-fold protein
VIREISQLSIDSFFGQARGGKLVGLKCPLGHVTVPPRHSCRVCQSQELQLVELSGKGKVVSFTDVYVKSKEFPLDTPYTLALVALEEGGHLIGVLRGAQFTPKHGAKVLVKFEDISGVIAKWPITFFDLE